MATKSIDRRTGENNESAGEDGKSTGVCGE